MIHFQRISPLMNFLLLLALAVLVLFLGACSDDPSTSSGDSGDDDDDDDEQDESPEDIITAIAEEMNEGYMENTAQALEDKVFLHISEDYEHAGFGKDELMAEDLEDVEEDDVRIDSWELSVDVDLDEDETSATVSMTNNVAATMEAEDDLNFDVSMTVIMQMESWFVLENDGQWRVIGEEAIFNEMIIGGGAQGAASDLSDVAVSVTELSAGDSFQITGDVQIPDIDDDLLVFAGISLDWGDERNNAQNWWDEAEVTIFEDVGDYLGQTYTFDLTMPDDGNPAGMEIPSSFPRGVDSVEVQIAVMVQENENGGEMIRFDGYHFDIPLKPLSNQEPCSPGASAGGDGLWVLNLESDDLEWLNLIEIVDLRVVGDDVYGVALYAQNQEGDDWQISPLEFTGEVDGPSISFGFEAGDSYVQYTATLDGTEITDGLFILEITQGEDLYEFEAQFTGRKLDNRCGGVTPDDVDSETLLVTIGDETIAYSINSSEDAEVEMSSTFTDLSGLMVRNAAVLLDDEIDGRWLMLGFYDDEGGYAALMEGDTLSEGSFTLQ
jgi:hypothetical protein